ncbi:MAG: RNA polymerase factor sigma-32 [Alphaproteobacteria bacterium]|nr:RNA polymerase factor sigma-32 [Alphaproteobacteria bacterium]
MVKKAKDFDLVPAPASSDASGLQRYIQMVQAMPYLSEKEEFSLAKELQGNKSRRAAEVLVSSHLRLVVKVAYDFRHYGLPLGDLISEGNIGLMTAVKKFDPDKGFRLTTYALWWIRAMIQDYILSSWSAVKIGSASTQKKLFFGLKRVKEKLGVYDNRQMTPENIQKIAKELDVKDQDVYDMNARLSGDFSLNQQMKQDGESSEYIDFLESDQISQETWVEEKQEKAIQKEMIQAGLAVLNPREQNILVKRKLENSLTLRDLSAELGISAERVRQIEESAFKKFKQAVLAYDKKKALPNVSK